MASADVAGASAKLTLSAAIHRLQMSLLDDGPCTDSQLFAAGALLSRPDYEDVVVERSIAGHCGYPTCPNPLPGDRPRHGRYRISLGEHKVYDLEETYKFCGESCVVGSRAFSGSLSQERGLSVSPARLAEVLRLFEDLSLKGLRRPAVGDAEDGDFGFSKLTIREKNGVAANEVTAEEWIGPSNAIEGYVPETERNQGAAGKRRARTNSKENSRPAKDSAGDDKKERDFASIIGATDPVSSVPPGLSFSSASSMVTSNCLERGIQRIEECSLNDKVKVMEPPFLKPSLKTSGGKARNRTVKWADEEKLGALVEIEGSVRSVDDKQNKARSASLDEEDDDSSLRFASAEACVAALAHASESVASGESEQGDADFSLHQPLKQE